MRYRKLIPLVVLLFVSCTTPTTPEQYVLPTTSEYTYYADVLVNEMWFVLQDYPDQIARVRANRGEVLTAECWKNFNKALGALATTPEMRQALQMQAIALVVKKL